jgi:hypothetical protein
VHICVEWLKDREMLIPAGGDWVGMGCVLGEGDGVVGKWDICRVKSKGGVVSWATRGIGPES